MHEAIYQRLTELAKTAHLATYSQIAPLADLSMDTEEGRAEISRLLGDIARHEDAAGRPMLTPLVVHAGQDNNPGEGFFAIAQEFGRFSGSRNQLQRLEFWVQEVNAVRAHWAPRR
jgi:hypothetical protein